MLPGVTPLGVYALAQIPGGASVTMSVVSGSLTLTGRSVALNVSVPVTKANLALTGSAVTFSTITGVGSGSLAMTPQPVALNVSMAITKANLTLTGQNVNLIFSGEQISAGQLTLTGYSVALNSTMAVQAGALVLTGRSVGLARFIPIEAARLTLTGNWVNLLEIGGGSSRRKKGRTGFEPVIKRPRPIEKPEPRKVWTPPIPDRVPAIEPHRPLPELVDRKELPADLLGMQHQIYTAEDISDVERFLSDYDQDQQDADDIADILALLD